MNAISRPNESEIAAVLSQILKSPEFLDSRRHRELLQYLVEKSSRSESLKETDIAHEVFGRDVSFDPATDTLVRSYISNLRKKLEHYYLTTEDQYRYRLEIPKGHYLVKFTAATPAARTPAARARHQWFYPATIALLIVVIGILIVRDLRRGSSDGPQPPAVSPLWSEFVQPKGRPTLIVLGDYFFLRERANNHAYYRLGKINSLQDLLEYARQNPDFGKRYVVNNFTYLRPSAPWGLARLLPILQASTNGVALKLASQFDADEFKTNNVIFIGSFRTMYVLGNFLDSFGIEYSTVPPSSFSVKEKAGNTVRVFRPERLSAGSLENDYGVLAKGRGPDGSVLMILTGFSEGGVIQAAQAACDPALFETIAAQYSPQAVVDPGSLTLVLGAEGMTQSLFKGDIKYLAGAGAPVHP